MGERPFLDEDIDAEVEDGKGSGDGAKDTVKTYLLNSKVHR
jgi:hypothetical protein